MTEEVTITGGWPSWYDWSLVPPGIKAQTDLLRAQSDALADAGDYAGATGKDDEAKSLLEPYKKKKDEKKKEEGKKPPPPTGPNPHPPEFIVDNNDAVAISTAPDVCRVGSTPTPFMSYALGGDDENYSPNVFSNGVAIKHNQSRIWYTRGDEPGTGLGVKSNTVSSKVIPNSHSSVVKVNGIWVQRHSDTCWLNNGNNPGEYTHVKSTEVNKAPDATDEQDKSAWQSFTDQLYDKSGTVQDADSIWDKAGEWWNDPSKIGTDASNFYNGLPTGSEVWQGTKNIGSGIANVGSQIWNDPKGSAGAAGDWVAGKASDGWEGAKDAWNTDGVAGVLGAGAGVALDTVNPLRKVKLAKKVGDGLEEIGDAGKAASKLPGNTAPGDGGARSSEKPKNTRNPCAHLAKGNPNGEGPYRGGSYDGTKGAGEDRESDHIPAKSVSPLGEGRSPAISKDKPDHRIAMSTGSGRDAKQWRKEQQRLIDAGRYRDATAMDYRDTRRVARQTGDPRKYNEALMERSAYHRCLEKHGLLPGKKG